MHSQGLSQVFTESYRVMGLSGRFSCDAWLSQGSFERLSGVLLGSWNSVLGFPGGLRGCLQGFKLVGCSNMF